MNLEPSLWMATNWLQIGKKIMTSQIADITSSSNFCIANVFFKSSLTCFRNHVYWSRFHVNIMTGSGVIKTFVYKGSTEIWKSNIHQSEIWSKSVDWDQLGIPNLAWMSLIKCY